VGTSEYKSGALPLCRFYRCVTERAQTSYVRFIKCSFRQTNV